MAGAVYEDANGEGYCCGGIRSGCDGIGGDGGGEGVVGALVCEVRPGGRGGFSRGVGGGVVDYGEGEGLDCEGAVGDGGAHPVGGGRAAGGFDDHVSALADLRCGSTPVSKIMHT